MRARSGTLAFNIPNLPRHYQARESDLADLRRKLGAGETTGIIGLRGMGGIGKTVLATALAREASEQARDPSGGDFPDGVAWLTFGRDALALTKAAELATAITGRTIRFESLDAARGQLGELTQDLALLVVLDDVWEPEAADPFTGLGQRCHVLITTRIVPVLTRAGASRHDVGLLASPAARDFLAAATALPNADALPPEADAIIRQCGRLPLALAAAGALIRTHAFTWIDAAEALEEGATEEFDTSWLPDPEQRSVAVVMRVSVERLPPEAKACFLACAVFREDVEIPESALFRLWSSIVPNQRRAKLMAMDLEGRSLLISDEQYRYRIHDLYSDYLRYAATPLVARQADFVATYRSTCPSGWDTCPNDGYILRHLPWHLREAEQTDALQDLLFNPSWLRHKLAHTDINAVIADFRLLPDDTEAASLAAAMTLSAHVLARDPDKFGQQLVSRLVPAHGPAVLRLLDEFRSSCGLAPEWGPYLTPPGTELRRFEGHARWVNSVATLPDGFRALSGSNDSTLRLWDIDTGAELRRFEGHTSWVVSVAVLTAGRRALSGSVDRTLRLWDLETGAELCRFDGHSDRVNSVVVLPCGRRALSASHDHTLRLWDLATGAEIRRLTGHADRVLTATVLPDGRRALSGSWDRTMCLWDIDTGSVLRRFKGHADAVNSVAVLPDGRFALSGSDDRTLRLWDLETGRELRRFEGHSDAVNSVVALPDRRRALSGSGDKTLRLWDLETGFELRCLKGHTNPVSSVVVQPNGRRVLSGSMDWTLRLWDIDANVGLQRFEGHANSVQSVAVLPNCCRALSGSKDGTLRLWDLDTSAEVFCFEGHAHPIRSVAVLPDGRRALSGSEHRTLHLWNLEIGAELRRFVGLRASVSSVAVLPDGIHALFGFDDATLSLQEIETGAELRRFDAHTGLVTSVALLPDRRRALSGSWDGTLRLWDIDTGAELRRFEGHAGRVNSVAALVGGRWALSGSDDKTLRLWDLETGAELRCFKGHENSVNSVAVLPDGRLAVSASDDWTLRLWDLQTGAELDRYLGDAAFTALASMRGGDRVLTGNAFGQVVPFVIQNNNALFMYI